MIVTTLEAPVAVGPDSPFAWEFDNAAGGASGFLVLVLSAEADFEGTYSIDIGFDLAGERRWFVAPGYDGHAVEGSAAKNPVVMIQLDPPLAPFWRIRVNSGKSTTFKILEGYLTVR